METGLNTIDQSGIRALLKARLEQPELYADKPLFIWQSAWHDGIQQGLGIDLMRQINKGKSKEEWRCFRIRALGNFENRFPMPNIKSKGITAGYFVFTNKPLSLGYFLNEVEQFMISREHAVPLIVYLPYRYQPVRLEAEHYIFEPDFETWAKTWQDSTIPDFIRGDGDKAGITYRWYSCFNDPDKGCSTPRVWLAVSFNLNGLIRATGKFRTNQSIGDLDEDLIRSAIQFGVTASKGHLSDDVIDDFVKHLKSKV